MKKDKLKSWNSLNVCVSKNAISRNFIIYYYKIELPTLRVEYDNHKEILPSKNVFYCHYVEKGKKIDTHSSLKPHGDSFSTLDEIKESFRKHMLEEDNTYIVNFN